MGGTLSLWHLAVSLDVVELINQKNSQGKLVRKFENLSLDSSPWLTDAKSHIFEANKIPNTGVNTSYDWSVLIVSYASSQIAPSSCPHTTWMRLRCWATVLPSWRVEVWNAVDHPSTWKTSWVKVTNSPSLRRYTPIEGFYFTAKSSLDSSFT